MSLQSDLTQNARKRQHTPSDAGEVQSGLPTQSFCKRQRTPPDAGQVNHHPLAITSKSIESKSIDRSPDKGKARAIKQQPLASLFDGLAVSSSSSTPVTPVLPTAHAHLAANVPDHAAVCPCGGDCGVGGSGSKKSHTQPSHVATAKSETPGPSVKSARGELPLEIGASASTSSTGSKRREPPEATASPSGKRPRGSSRPAKASWDESGLPLFDMMPSTPNDGTSSEEDEAGESEDEIRIFVGGSDDDAENDQVSESWSESERAFSNSELNARPAAVVRSTRSKHGQPEVTQAVQRAQVNTVSDAHRAKGLQQAACPIKKPLLAYVGNRLLLATDLERKVEGGSAVQATPRSEVVRVTSDVCEEQDAFIAEVPGNIWPVRVLDSIATPS